MFRFSTAVFGGIIVLAGSAGAQDGHEAVRPSLVYLKASAQVASGPNTSNTVDGFATGFLVSNDGLVLTVYHLITELGDIVPSSFRVEGRVGAKNANVLTAAVVDASINVDLLLLKLPPDVQAYPKVSLGNAQSHSDSDPIFTSGFPKSITYRKQSGQIEAREGPGGYLWATDLNFEEGQSGSPVYDETGVILGLVKGDQGNLHYMIPIEFADPLLTQVRLRDLEKAIIDMRKRIDALEQEAPR